MKKRIIILGGPTASGKTDAAIRLARRLDTEIISADSRQIYHELTIGTAKPSPEELSKVPHHLIGHISIHEPYNVGKFEKEALKIIQKVHETKDVLIIVGGTGLYHRALLRGMDSFPDVEQKIVTKLQLEFENKGIKSLQDELKAKDKNYASYVDLENPYRLIRALSIIRKSGQPYSSFLNKSQVVRSFGHELYYLDLPREVLYERINHRVDRMIESGLKMEALQLYHYRHLQALQTVGYKEYFNFFDGAWTESFAIEKIKQHTRNYAKRQLTWLRNQGNYKNIHPEEINQIVIK